MPNLNSGPVSFSTPGRLATESMSLYPLQYRAVVWGVWVGVIGGCLFMSPVVGFALLTLFGTIGALWRRDEPPILPFCIGYQWTFIVTGYFYQLISGSYPDMPYVGDLETAIALSLVGLIVIVVGLRIGFLTLQHQFERRRIALAQGTYSYDIRRLFFCVVAFYTISWLVQIAPMEIQFNASQFIYRVLEFREIFFFLLFLVIFQEQKSYRYGAAGFVYVLLPTLTSEMSQFKGPFFLLLLALLSEWHPWSEVISERDRSSRIFRIGIILIVVLMIFGVIWQGGMKNTWRSQLRSGEITGSPMKKIGDFVVNLQESVSKFQLMDGVESLAARFSSGVAYFSLVVDQMPRLIPHEEGTLTMRALEHTFKPRILFPDKPNLGGDSWLVRQYAGIDAAGEESQTSVGLGYMAEFYIDFGILGMFVPVFIYGLLMGLIYMGVLLFSPSYSIYVSAVTVIFTQHFVSYEGEIAKLLGGLMQSFVVFALLLGLLGLWIHRQLTAAPEASSLAEDINTHQAAHESPSRL